MAEMVFGELQKLSKQCGGGCPADSWESIKPQVEIFIKYQPPTYIQRAFGVIPVRNVTFKGYDFKIRLLDGNYQLDQLYKEVYRGSRLHRESTCNLPSSIDRF
jgi:hypothetical protein